MNEAGGPEDRRHDGGESASRAPDPAANRSHNRDTLSSEAMTELLRDLQDSMLALDQRVSGLETARDQASAETRRLAVSVVEMGDALARRVRALEASGPAPEPPVVVPPPRPTRRKPDRRPAWMIGMALLLGMVLAGLWVARGQLIPKPTPPAAPTSAPAPVPAPPQAAVPDPVPVPPPRRRPSR